MTISGPFKKNMILSGESWIKSGESLNLSRESLNFDEGESLKDAYCSSTISFFSEFLYYTYIIYRSIERKPWKTKYVYFYILHKVCCWCSWMSVGLPCERSQFDFQARIFSVWRVTSLTVFFLTKENNLF